MKMPNSTWKRYSSMHGFTLTELIVAVLILGILTTTALPYFRTFIVAQRIKSASFDIMATLIQARSEAIKRNNTVTVAPSGSDWHYGWNVTTVTTAGVTITLSTQSALGSGLTITCFAGGTAVATCPALTYSNNGRLTGAAAPAIQMSSTDTTSANTRCISISLSGLPNSKKGTC